MLGYLTLPSPHGLGNVRMKYRFQGVRLGITIAKVRVGGGGLRLGNSFLNRTTKVVSIIVSLQHSHHQIITSRIELKYVQFKCYASYRQGPVLVVQAHVGAVGRGDEHRGVGGQGQDGHRALVAPVETSPAQQNILSEMVCMYELHIVTHCIPNR